MYIKMVTMLQVFEKIHAQLTRLATSVLMHGPTTRFDQQTTSLGISHTGLLCAKCPLCLQIVSKCQRKLQALPPTSVARLILSLSMAGLPREWTVPCMQYPGNGQLT